MATVKSKLNVGCGLDIRDDYVNLDVVGLPGVDVVHNLTTYPWPFSNDSFDKIIMVNVLEHLPDTIATLEELHRISRPGADIEIRVPFWNSSDMLADPTHVRSFNERTLNFFDEKFSECRERPYYSKARFRIEKKICYIKFFYYLKISWKPLTKLLFFIARYFGSIVWVVEFHIRCVKTNDK